MVADRFDPPRGEEGTPSAEGTTASPPRQRTGALQTWLPLIVSVLLMPVLAYVTTLDVLVPHLEKSLAKRGSSASATSAGTASNSGPAESAVLNKLLVNVAGTMGSRYLLTSLTLVGKTPDFKTTVDQHDAELRDMACGLLSTKTITDLEKPGARNLIRSELLNGFNHILGGATVQDIYFTEFAIQ